MLTALSFESAAGNATGGTITFLIGSAAGTGITVTSLGVQYELEGTEKAKMQAGGQHDRYAYVRRLLLPMRGFIKDDDATGWAATRQAFVQKLLPDADTQEQRYHGTLKATFTGIGQVYAQVNLRELDVPLDVDEGGPFVSEYNLSFVANYGYWRAVSGNAVVKI